MNKRPALLMMALLIALIGMQPKSQRTIAHHPAEKLAEALVERYGAAGDYDALRVRLARLSELDDPYRLAQADQVLREPFALPALSREMAAIPANPRAALFHASVQLGYPFSTQVDTRGWDLSSWDAYADELARRLECAHDSLERAFVDLDDDERAFLRRALPDVADSFREVVMVLSDPDEERLRRVRRWVELAERVRVVDLASAAWELAKLLEDDHLDALRRAAKRVPGEFAFRRDTPFGAIVIAGAQANWHREEAAVLIDLGGDDVYTQPTASRLSVLIDLGGDDLYQATFDGTQAAGIMGVSLLHDGGGDDVYVGQQWAQGAAAVGVGLLHDAGGDDVYRASDYSQAAALVGIGLVCDAGGNDRFESPRYAQGIGMPRGFAALVDRAGDDHYYVGGRDRTNYGTVGVFDAFGQGCGIGFRKLAAGGIGVLRDDAGDDHYVGHNFAQGGGYYFGWGVLFDRAGDDRYHGCRYAQAWAAHQAFGLLEDEAGDDRYLCWRTVGQSCSWDETVTALIDGAGDDVYSGEGPYARGGFALCAAHHNGLALFVDAAGRDRYPHLSGPPRADGNDEVTSFSLFVDVGGAADVYGEDSLNDGIRHGHRHGFLVDLPGELEGAWMDLDELAK